MRGPVLTCLGLLDSIWFSETFVVTSDVSLIVRIWIADCVDALIVTVPTLRGIGVAIFAATSVNRMSDTAALTPDYSMYFKRQRAELLNERRNFHG